MYAFLCGIAVIVQATKDYKGALSALGYANANKNFTGDGSL